MSPETHPTVVKYRDLYRKLYNREPKGFRNVDRDFVIVNETKIRISDLEALTAQLEQEYRQMQKTQRNTLLKLVNWFLKN